MALNFPDNPTTGQLYADSTSGFTYQWDGVVWKSYTAAAAANIRIIDDIESSFNGSTTTFALTSSGAPVTPVSPQQLRIVLGGIVQEPAVDYNVAGSNIIFTTAPATGLSFSGVLLGSAISPVGLASTGSVYYRQSYSPTGVQTTFTVSGGYRVGYLDVYHNGVKLVVTDDYTATNGSTFDLVTPANNGDTVEAVTFLYTQLYSTTGFLDNLFVNGNATVTGITTLGNTVVGGGTTQLLVNGDARVTGILTVGTSSITLDGTNNTINVGTLSISQSGISGGTPNITVGFITATGASISGNVTVSGNVGIAGTLTYEDVTNVDSVGLITARSGIRVSSGSSIGIGTGSPRYLIHLSTDANGTADLALDGGTTSGKGPLILFRQEGTSKWFVGTDSTINSGTSDDLDVYTAGSRALRVYTNNTERLRIAGTGAFGLSGANYGTSGQVLTSQGSAAAPQWATPAAGGSMIYISSVTANNSASVAFTSGIDSTYDAYVIIGIGIIPIQDSQLYGRTSSNGGSTYDSGSGDYSTSGYNQDLTVGSLTQLELAGNIESTSSSGCDFEFYIYNPSNTSRRKYMRSHIFRQTPTAGTWNNATNAHMRHSTSAINAIQFYMGAGNISTGTFRLYGIKNS